MAFRPSILLRCLALFCLWAAPRPGTEAAVAVHAQFDRTTIIAGETVIAELGVPTELVGVSQ